ncbi:MAG: tetratricopeptide repeat protein [Chthoniobacterales bacterium]
MASFASPDSVFYLALGHLPFIVSEPLPAMSRQPKIKPNELTARADMASSRWILIAISLLLAALVWIVFGQTLKHDFVDFDDLDYVTKNAQVSRGLSFEGFAWAFTHFHSANWHPLTWLSHMVDCQLYGLNPWGHHLTNVLIHAANAILLFFLLRQMTGTAWRSVFVAALFAIHPLRVESVAWVSERKDVLSGLFFLLTLMAYTRYARGPSRSRYLTVVVLFALGLMCKPMLVTLPLVLLLLDYWPLDRLPTLSINTPEQRKRWWLLLREKLPLLALSLASSVVTMFAQRESLQPIEHISFSARLANVGLSYLDYLRQMVWPTNLAPLYPWETDRLQPAAIAIAFLFLAAISVIVMIWRRQRCLVTGWLWYLVMLLPVIGILHVGNQSHADRYTYLPQIGLYLMLGWGVAELCARWRPLWVPVTAAAAGAIVTLTVAARTQASYWEDSESLWRHALSATSDNIIAESNLALALYWKGKNKEAMEHFEQSLMINRRQPEPLSSLGAFYLALGRFQDALAVLHEALQLEPRLEDAYYNLGNTYLALGDARQALDHYKRALELAPDDTEALNNMAWILATWPNSSIRNGVKAVALAERADSLTRSRNQIIAATLAAAYAETGRFTEAKRTAEHALRLAAAEGNEARVRSIRAQLETYKSNNAYHDERYQ